MRWGGLIGQRPPHLPTSFLPRATLVKGCQGLPQDARACGVTVRLCSCCSRSSTRCYGLYVSVEHTVLWIVCIGRAHGVMDFFGRAYGVMECVYRSSTVLWHVYGTCVSVEHTIRGFREMGTRPDENPAFPGGSPARAVRWPGERVWNWRGLRGRGVNLSLFMEVTDGSIAGRVFIFLWRFATSFRDSAHLCAKSTAAQSDAGGIREQASFPASVSALHLGRSKRAVDEHEETQQWLYFSMGFTPQRTPPGVSCGVALQPFLGEGGAGEECEEVDGAG
eukprot:gene9331-biopygen18209